MSIVKEKKLKQLYQLLPEDVVAPSHWLTTHGYSSQLLYKYVESEWLVRVSRGAYEEQTLLLLGRVLCWDYKKRISTLL